MAGDLTPGSQEPAAPTASLTEDAPDPRAPTSRHQARRARSLRRRRVLAGAVALGLLVLGFVAWFLFEAFPIGGSGRPVVFQVVPGESMSDVTSTLAAKGVIGSTLAFRIDLAVMGTPSVAAGWYQLDQSSSFSTVRGVLASGPNVAVLPVITGETTHEMALSLASSEGTQFATSFLSIVRDPSGVVHSPYQPTATTPLEGLLAPGLYVLPSGTTPASLLTEMAAKFVPRAIGQGLYPSTRAHGLDAYQLITVASIVEKEGYLARNMPPVATVIYNRLARGMPLQMDATVEYAINQDGGTVTHATEQIQSPYNTYLNLGITPTPICVPSTEAIDAALHPASGQWLYFTLIDHAGTLAFADTFAEQLANEQLAAERGL